MLIPSVGDVVLAEITSGGVGTGERVPVEVLHVHRVAKTGAVQVQVRSLHPVRVGRMNGRKIDHTPMIAVQYVDLKWLSEKGEEVDGSDNSV